MSAGYIVPPIWAAGHVRQFTARCACPLSTLDAMARKLWKGQLDATDVCKWDDASSLRR
jgi:hypothetical protein